MDSLIKVFGNIQLSSVVLLIAAIVFLAGILVKIYNFIVTVHDNLQERDETIKTVNDSLKQIQEQQKTITDDITKLFNRQEELYERQNSFEKNWNSFNLTKMKNSLLQSYRYYCSTTKNPMHAWTELEKEVFDNLFDDYEKLGGDGFMHSVVQPEIEKLDVIPMSDVEQIQLLYSSRKN